MEFNRATTLTKVLVRERALEARQRKDEKLAMLRDNVAYPGSPKFPQAVEVIVQYMADLAEVEISSVKDAHEQTGIPLGAEAIERALRSLGSSFDTLIQARIASWQDSLNHVTSRTRATAIIGGNEALAEARRELTRQAARLIERADARLDVLLQSSLAASEKSAKTTATESSKEPSTKDSQQIPSWFPKAGATALCFVIIFVTALVVSEIRGTRVPASTRSLVDIVIALGVAFAACFLGGSAQAEGKIPFLKEQEPIRFAATGGIAVFVIVLCLLFWFYH